MRSLFAVIACPIAALAASIPARTLPVPFEPFTAGAWRPPTAGEAFFFGTAINASGGKFYINSNTSTYCPDEVPGLDCSAYSGSQTVFVIGNGTTTMSLDVSVPGGQQVYIAPDGSLSYTQAHSALMPTGSIVTGFGRVRSEASGAPVVLYNPGLSWYLCPVTEGEPRERTYQVFASSEGVEGCLGAQVRTYTPLEGEVWQYA